eukprot:786585-Amphidinium_carterae.1
MRRKLPSAEDQWLVESKRDHTHTTIQLKARHIQRVPNRGSTDSTAPPQSQGPQKSSLNLLVFQYVRYHFWGFLLRPGIGEGSAGRSSVSE